jgi:transcriptional regulator with XRE-family HTH domain
MRRQAGLSQSELGGGVIWRSAVSRIESGVRVPSVATLHLFAIILRCPLRELLLGTWTHPSRPEP